ncbi:DNA-3-methyladenine glycosylase [Candidatus Saccharibacteria bacterium]|nr:DNA-3-methyladenine glycosylase [Candidatus Saccharibacteria bacterium]
MSLNNLCDVLNNRAPWCAERLLGCELVRILPNEKVVRVRIVETEAYCQSDAASHSYKGKTPRTDVMFGPAGFAYVYFTYGMHYCMNVVVGNEGEGAAVLVRAVEVLEGEREVAHNRPKSLGAQMTNGPAKLCQALCINRDFNGHDLSQHPLRLIIKPPLKKTAIVQTTRVGISKAKDVKWRWYIRNNVHVSRR